MNKKPDIIGWGYNWLHIFGDNSNNLSPEKRPQISPETRMKNFKDISKGCRNIQRGYDMGHLTDDQNYFF